MKQLLLGVEVTIKYDADALEECRFGEASKLEDAKEKARENGSLMPEDSESYTIENGEREYILTVVGDEYLYFTANDKFGNNTSSYVYVDIP